MVRRRPVAVLATGGALVVALGVGTAFAVHGDNSRSDRVEAARFQPVDATGCSVRYTLASQQGKKFSADVALQGAPKSGTWRLTWNYAAGQQVRRIAGSDWKQAGTHVTVRGTGRSANLRLEGKFSGTNPTPSAFAVNGVACVTDSPGTPPGTTTASKTGATTSTTPNPVTSTTTSTTRSQPTTSTTTRTTTSTTTRTTTSTTTSSTTTSSTVAPTTIAPPPGGTLGAGRIQFGPTYSGDGTFYGATGEGNCLYDRNSDLMVAAMNAADYDSSNACGAYVEATGPKGKVTVKIVDQCPECKPGDIDFSTEAFAKIADPVAGRVHITWHLLSPALDGPVAYRYKEGSSQWWCGIQVRNHRNPVLSLEALVGGSWQKLPRQSYNYFVSADGSGCGKPVRVTDIYGNQVTGSTSLTIVVGTVQNGSGQFGAPR